MHQGLRSRIGYITHSRIMQPCKPCNSSSARCCSGSFQWQAPLCPEGSTVTRATRDRPHLEDASITQLFKFKKRQKDSANNFTRVRWRSVVGSCHRKLWCFGQNTRERLQTILCRSRHRKTPCVFGYLATPKTLNPKDRQHGRDDVRHGIIRNNAHDVRGKQRK